MKVTGLDHITVNVKDLGRSKAFYGDVLGLIDYEAKEEPKDIKETDTGTYRHFCLVAAQLDEVYSTCRNKGVSIRKTPSYVDQLGCRTMLITDPNGVEIEIIQR